MADPKVPRSAAEAALQRSINDMRKAHRVTTHAGIVGIIPPSGALSSHDLNPAEWMRERLLKQIKDFEGQLNSEEEVGVSLAMSTSSHAFHIERVGYWGPDMIILSGTNTDGKPVQLLQHYTQVSVLLTALPRIHEPARRIGFDLTKNDGGG